MNKNELVIDWATHKAAKYACEKWHYSKCLPVGKLVKVGVWEEKKFIGVVVFGRGSAPHLGTAYKLRQDQCVELVRIALTEHQTAVSRIVSIAIKFLKKSNPKLKLIVSFADPDQGHKGGVYQAGNWIYSGDSGKSTEYFVNKKWRHVRGAWYVKNDKTPTRERQGKHRYLMPLDNETKEKIIKLQKPYPKREKQAMDSIPESQRRCDTDLHAPILKKVNG